MAIFAESAPQAHLVYGPKSGRSAAWTWASSQVRLQRSFDFCVAPRASSASRRVGRASHVSSLRVP